jgi:DNA-binding response OmpR family regulator
MTDRPTVLIADDEPSIADGHAMRLEEQYDVRTAYSGSEALEQLDEAVDVVLLDRRMPGVSGDEVLGAIRERDLPCRVAMVTAVEPTFDIAGMGFDGYLQKPVDREELFETVETLHRRVEYDTRLQEFFSVASRVAVLRTQFDGPTLDHHDEFDRLTDRLEELREELDETLSDLPARESIPIAARGKAPVGDEFEA